MYCMYSVALMRIFHLEWWTFDRDAEYFYRGIWYGNVASKGRGPPCSVMLNIILTVNYLG